MKNKDFLNEKGINLKNIKNHYLKGKDLGLLDMAISLYPEKYIDIFNTENNIYNHFIKNRANVIFNEVKAKKILPEYKKN